MKLLEKIHSKTDKTIKYIFLTEDKLIIELAYINKNDGKDIICAPAQTTCRMGCRFCHITDATNKLILRDITSAELKKSINYIYNDLELDKDPKTLLISFMGCGEPLFNVDNLVGCMTSLRKQYKDKIPLIRYAIATSLPEKAWLNFFELTEEIQRYKLPVKIHLSLHYTNDYLRSRWMPNALDIAPSILALEYYKTITTNTVEIHYALIDNVNDREEDAILLTEYLKGRGIPVKFLFYNEKPTLEFHASSQEKLEVFKKHLDKAKIDFEYYIPPGLDVGASCGQFLMDYYLKYNTIAARITSDPR